MELLKPYIHSKSPLASTQLTSYTAHANTVQIDPFLESIKKRYSTELSRTQHKLMLQRQSFLADDKNYIDHPQNMRKLTKELDRVNKEYRHLKQFQDPLLLSLRRVTALQDQPSLSSSCSSSYSFVSPSPPSSSLFMLSPPPHLQRRASSHTVKFRYKGLWAFNQAT
ncbi:uncharacterized protein B0P05DRAFT_588346 [Gilbertella persicaria]|uniref:uncharacterized protein n=1 Tax=Gilbertella persicaria TaxID=101096 RepID=UPI00221F15C1|nr:uncharacterized protein B0P05DRAFT_588346 [Gilbertella persicaria]KAI8075929.1 hypothetical protein B0P05DRAFT_588346 [Gilbertella persicaria]